MPGKTKRPCLMIGLIELLLAIWLASCSLVVRTPADLPAKQPSPTPGKIADFQPARPLAQQPAYTACDVEAQTAALRAGTQPDWESLSLAACYQLSIELLPDLPGYTGQSSLTFTNPTGVPLETIVFRLYPNAQAIYGGDLEITAAQIAGQPIATEIFLPDRSALRLPLVPPLAPGDTVVVDLAFSGILPRDLAGTEQAYGIFNASSDPPRMVLANWYPILAEWEAGAWTAAPVNPIGDAVVSESALYEVSISLPDGWQVATTGTERAPGQYTAGPVRDFMIVAGQDFSVQDQFVNGVRVRQFGTSAENYRWEAGLQAVVDAFNLFDEQFGAYPYSELDLVAVPLRLAQGVEYPGLFLIREELYRPDEPQPFLLGLVIAHETAHQWWYGVIGNDVLQAPWQDEALATYSSMLYQQAYQPEVFPGTLAYYESSAAEALKNAPDPSIGQPVGAFRGVEAFYGPLIYQRGALFLAALAREIGEQAFTQAMQSYYLQHRFALLPPETLLKEFEQQCTCDLATFYRQWGLTTTP